MRSRHHQAPPGPVFKCLESVLPEALYPIIVMVMGDIKDASEGDPAAPAVDGGHLHGRR